MRIKLEAYLKGAMCLHCLHIKSYNVKKGCISSDRGSFAPFWCIGIGTGIGKSRIKDVLSHLSKAVSEKRASELLHSMVVSQDILFWTPHGQLLWNKRIILVTNIADLCEYVLLPHNDDITKPRALNTFLDELAELGFDRFNQEQKVAKWFNRKGKRLPKCRRYFR